MSFNERIRKLYEQIQSEQDLSPAPHINRLFGELVREVTCVFDEKSGLSKKEERLLQEICSRAEYKLERYWAERIVRPARPKRS